MCLGLCGLLASTLAGCPVPQSPQQSTTFSGADKRPELSCAREGAERVDVASWRGTGRPDVARVYMRNPDAHGQAVLSCREVDLNGDGRKDILVYYDSEGRKQREEFDHDYDGLADVKSYYEQGQLVRQEVDLNHDGKPDVMQYFEGGKLVRVEHLMPGAEGDKPAAPAAPAAIDKPAPPADGPSTPPAAAPAQNKLGG